MKKILITMCVFLIAFCCCSCGGHSYDEGYDDGYQAGLSEGYENGYEDGSVELDDYDYGADDYHIVLDDDFYERLIDFMNSGYADDPGMMSDFINDNYHIEY